MNKKKKILIIAHMIRGGGAETFLRGILPCFVKDMDYAEISCIVAASRKGYYDCLSNLEIIAVEDTILNDTKKRLVFDNYTLVKLVKQKKPDLIFSAAEIVPYSLVRYHVPIVLVYHATLQFYMKCDTENSCIKLLYTRIMRDRIAKKADIIVGVSHYERGEIGARYHCHRFDKSAVVYHGVDHSRFFPLSKDEIVNQIFPFKYILCISDIHTHKKIDEMIEIYRFMVEMGIEEHLVIIGREKNQEASLKVNNAIVKYGLNDRVHIVNYIDNSKLRDVYINSTIYWTHSCCESFGMTPLEAMACGIPVFAVWREALPEIYGSSVYFYGAFDNDMRKIAQKATHFIQSTELREEYAKKGFERSLEFTWERSAKEYESLINKLIGTT